MKNIFDSKLFDNLILLKLFFNLIPDTYHCNNYLLNWLCYFSKGPFYWTHHIFAFQLLLDFYKFHKMHHFKIFKILAMLCNVVLHWKCYLRSKCTFNQSIYHLWIVQTPNFFFGFLLSFLAMQCLFIIYLDFNFHVPFVYCRINRFYSYLL